DPRFLARRASRDDRGEIAVVSYLEATGSKRAPKRARQVKAMERQDRPVARFDPEQVGRVAAVGHRENAGGITLQQQARVEATHVRDSIKLSRGRPPAGGTGARLWGSRQSAG